MIPQLIAASAKLNIGLKKMKCFSTDKTASIGPVCINDGEIEHPPPCHGTTGHIPSFRHEGGYLRMGAFVEQHAIEHTVDNVPKAPRQDQRHRR